VDKWQEAFWTFKDFSKWSASAMNGSANKSETT
jgi:hypothetical protein